MDWRVVARSELTIALLSTIVGLFALFVAALLAAQQAPPFWASAISAAGATVASIGLGAIFFWLRRRVEYERLLELVKASSDLIPLALPVTEELSELSHLYYETLNQNGQPIWRYAKLHWNVIPGTKLCVTAVSVRSRPEVGSRDVHYSAALLNFGMRLILLLQPRMGANNEPTACVILERTVGWDRVFGIQRNHGWSGKSQLGPVILSKSEEYGATTGFLSAEMAQRCVSDWRNNVELVNLLPKVAG